MGRNGGCRPLLTEVLMELSLQHENKQAGFRVRDPKSSEVATSGSLQDPLPPPPFIEQGFP